MEVVKLVDAAAFLAEAEPLLLADEARHNLILGLAGTIRDSPDHYPSRSLWLVRDEGGKVAAAALRTPPYNLILAAPRSEEALAVLARGIAEDLPGVVGAEPESVGVRRFLVAEHRPSRADEHAPGRLRARRRFNRRQACRDPPVSRRPATASSRCAGGSTFGDEVAPRCERGRDDRREARSTTGSRLRRRGSCSGRTAASLVSLAAWGGPTPNGIRIGPVYTPPELRGHGYATALSAELSQRLLDGRLFAGGRRFCFLYTDLANSTSNAIYERIGYRRVAESAEIVFG